MKLLTTITKPPDQNAALSVLTKLTRIKTNALERFQTSYFHDILRNSQTLQSAYDPVNIISVLDAPFSCLYITAVFFLSPILGWVSLSGVLFVMASGFYSVHQTKKTSADLEAVSIPHKNLVSSAIRASDTVRTFGAGNFLTAIWKHQINATTSLRLKLSENKESSQATTLSASTVMSVLLYSIGAYYIVQGDLTVGALIGANILASRAYTTMVKLVQTGYLIAQATSSEKRLKQFFELPEEQDKGTAIKAYTGRIAFKDISFGYPGSTGPLFESFTMELSPGEILMVTGNNATGKTTLARLAAGLLLPVRGDIMADGISLRQISLPWWRKQIMYLPQEPTFLNASIKDNLTLMNPEIDDTRLNQILRLADLKSFLDKTPGGLDTLLSDGGKHLALGIRRRLAIARALVTDGKFIIFDEPMEGLDEEGKVHVHQLLNFMVSQKKTIIICSHDARHFTGEGYILDLNHKPVPKLNAQNKKTAGPDKT